MHARLSTVALAFALVQCTTSETAVTNDAGALAPDVAAAECIERCVSIVPRDRGSAKQCDAGAAGSRCDLSGLRKYSDKAEAVAVLFRADADAIVVGGPSASAFGYLATERTDFGDMVMSFEWKWVTTPGNSGIFVLLSGPDMIWPRTLEMQLLPDRAGDILALSGLVIRDAKTDAVIGGVAKTGGGASQEMPLGQWNRGEIEIALGHVRIKVNDVLVSEAKVDPLERGAIAFEAEGGEIHFRNVVVRE